MKELDWRTEEFETLLQHPGADDEAVAELLPKRKMAAVGVVRQGVHAYHSGMDTSVLSQMMVRRLQFGSVRCPVCRTMF